MSIEKATERREYEKADGRRRKGLRSVKLPGEARHIERSESAEAIARGIAISKREKRLEALRRG
ncbi:hypothetical protein [Bosea sp. (in: a-proteobacteria)]|jgi:hypothetical protein|uniref:hypothetical protein n=1 Tax=Bosea sp. (in: a-proteobacteria) TaxID=1871050 RepID=UPI003F7229E1